MGQAGKYLFGIIGLGLVGAVAVAGGCSLTTNPGPSGHYSQGAATAGTFFIAIGFLLLVGAVIVMIVWGLKSLRS